MCVRSPAGWGGGGRDGGHGAGPGHVRAPSPPLHHPLPRRHLQIPVHQEERPVPAAGLAPAAAAVPAAGLAPVAASVPAAGLASAAATVPSAGVAPAAATVPTAAGVQEAAVTLYKHLPLNQNP